MDMHRTDEKLDKGFFYTKRPIKTILRIMHELNNLGAETYILSFCSYYYQKTDKMKWLKRYCEFIPENNIIIIPRRESDINLSKSKEMLKAEYLKEYVSDNDTVYVIDDNESVLLGIKSKMPQINIVSPIDFIE